MTDLLSTHGGGHPFVSGCAMNQGKFYPLLDRIVLLSAPAEVTLARIAERADNPCGKDAAERQEIPANLAEIEPLLRRAATDEIVTRVPLAEVVSRLEAIADGALSS